MKIAQISLMISTAIYIIIYLIVTFMVWEIRNPFQWIIDLPTYSNLDRLMIITTLIMYYGILHTVASDISKRKK